jgi:hypothetical protein
MDRDCAAHDGRDRALISKTCFKLKTVGILYNLKTTPAGNHH